MNEQFRELLKQASTLTGLTEKEIARRLEVNHTYLSSLKNGKRQVTSKMLSKLQRLIREQKDNTIQQPKNSVQSADNSGTIMQINSEHSDNERLDKMLQIMDKMMSQLSEAYGIINSLQQKLDERSDKSE